MNHHYRSYTILFGYAVPILLTALLCGGVVLFKNNMADRLHAKEKSYQDYQRRNLEAMAIEAEIARLKEQTAHWQSFLTTEPASVVSNVLSTIEDELPPEEFQITTRDFPSNRSGFAGMTKQPATQVHLAFRASYRSVQRAMLELETRFPNLQLHNLILAPDSSSNLNSNLLNVTANYTIWEP